MQKINSNVLPFFNPLSKKSDSSGIEHITLPADKTIAVSEERVIIGMARSLSRTIEVLAGTIARKFKANSEDEAIEDAKNESEIKLKLAKFLIEDAVYDLADYSDSFDEFKPSKLNSISEIDKILEISKEVFKNKIAKAL